MLRVTAILLFVLMCSLAMAQDNRHKEYLKHEGDANFNDEQYNLAIEYYRELANLTDVQPDILYRLAESYRQTFNYQEAEVYYLKAYYQKENKFPLALYYYALMLKLNGNFDESIQFFSDFISLAETKPELKEYAEQAIVDRAGSEMAKVQLQKSTYRLNTENINTVFNDYAPALRDSTTLVITSGRVQSNRQALDDRYGEGFTDNYYFVKSSIAWLDKTRQVFNVTNTKYNEGSGCFNYTGDKYYFTFCGKGDERCGIYVTAWRNNKWSEPVPLNENINTKNSQSKHPAISKGGDTLLFASNRTGGYGNYDIWISVNSGKDDWGPAMNMGASVNTKLNELSPAFTIYSHIFFLASDGHQSYGGLDVYMAKRLSNGTIDLYNLDYPFNSSGDDCFITLNNQKLFFSSNRSGGKGGFDIYSVSIPSIVSFTSRLSLKNKGARGDVKLNARTETVNNRNLLASRNEDRIDYENLTYEKKKLVDKMIATQTGNQTINRADFPELNDREFNALQYIAETQFKSIQFERKFSGRLLTKLNTAGKANELNITGIVRDSSSRRLLANQKILLMDQSGEVLKITSTNESGQFRFTNVSSGSTLYIRLEHALPANENAVLEALNMVGSGTESQRFENIYFDFDHYTLRPEAMQVLNDLAPLLKQNPSAQVELFAYADDRGADDYNLRLTQKRGQAVLNYLTAKGVDQTALAIIAKGRQDIGIESSEIQRQLNRRVEFYLNGMDSGASNSIVTYILKKKSTWIELSESTSIPEKKLKALNGSSADAQLFQPIRLPAGAVLSSDLFFIIN